jgi:hypothetical protein
MCVVLCLGCSKDAGREADLLRDDRARMELIIAEDMRASRAMAEADEAARRGDVPGAIEAVEARARPAIEAGLTAAHIQARTSWGLAKQDALVKILADRKAELTPYTEAVKSNDPQKLVGSIEAQAKIERRAIAAVQEVRDASEPR